MIDTFYCPAQYSKFEAAARSVSALDTKPCNRTAIDTLTLNLPELVFGVAEMCGDGRRTRH
jgi:hypothetical protein